jgi:hypothetical protein
MILMSLGLASYGTLTYLSAPARINKKATELFDRLTTNSPTPVSPTPISAPSPEPSPTPSPARSPTPTPHPTLTPTATPVPTPSPTVPRALPLNTPRKGYYYVTLINQTRQTLTYRTATSSEQFVLTPHYKNNSFYTHWWSSPEHAKIRIFGASGSTQTEAWHSLETKYFDHQVAAKSNERDLIPVYEIFQEADQIIIRKAPSSGASPDRETFEDNSEVRWQYYADIFNDTGVPIVIEHQQAEEWVRLELEPGESKTIGADSARVDVRVCECADREPASLEGWPINAAKSGTARSSHEFYLDRHGKINLRTVSP